MASFKITIEKMTSEYSTEVELTPIVKTVISETLKEAKKAVKALKKEFSLQNHAGHVVNYSDQLELYTNF